MRGGSSATGELGLAEGGGRTRDEMAIVSADSFSGQSGEAGGRSLTSFRAAPEEQPGEPAEGAGFTAGSGSTPGAEPWEQRVQTGVAEAAGRLQAEARRLAERPDAPDLLRRGAARTAEAAGRVSVGVRDGDWPGQVRMWRAQGRDQLRTHYKSHPVRTAAVVVGAGLLLGRLLKGRSA